MSRLKFLVVACSLLVALGMTAVSHPATAQTTGLTALRGQLLNMERDLRNLELAIEQQTNENARIVSQLDTFDDNTPITFETLQQAQFEVDIGSTRLMTLAHTVAEQTERVDALNAAIVSASADLRSGTRDTLAGIVEEEMLDWRRRIRDVQNQILERLTVYQALSSEYLSLRQEQLAIIQNLITLDAIEGVRPSDEEPIVLRLTQLVDQLSQAALALSNEASGITETNSAAIQRRNLLRLRSDETLLRSTARLTDIAIVQSRSTLDALRTLPDEPSIPIHLFEDAIDEVDEIDHLITQRLTTINANRSALEDLVRILGEPNEQNAVAQAFRQRVRGLDELLQIQREELGQLREGLVRTREALVRERAIRERTNLTRREIARTDPAARQRIATELSSLPGKLKAIYEGRLTEIETSYRVADQRRLIAFGIASLVFIGFVIWLRRGLLKRFIAADATRATEVPLEVLRRNLFWLVPAAIWWIYTKVFAISQETAQTILMVLVIPAAAALLRDLTQVIVTRRTVGGQRRIGKIITRSTEAAMILTTIVVFAYVVLDEVNLLPSTQSAINRLAYSVFVLSGLPLLLFVFFFAAPTADRSSYGRIRRWVAGILSLLPPAALIATGVTGLMGYTNLAATMMQNLAIAIAIAAVLALALGVLNDIMEGIAARARAKDPARAYFFRANFLQPLTRAGQVLLLVIAIAVAARIFEWTSETPGIHQFLTFWNWRLFDVGTSSYGVGSVVVAAAALVFVFWLGAWCRRVAYTVVFGRLKDIGIRQSLSVFAQYVVIVLGVLLTLSAVGFDVTTLTVFAASLGVGIGFGMQNVVNNFISGLLLLVERPLRLGDIVTVGANSGTVSQIGIRSMRLKTFDEFDLIVPNSALISDTFTNWTRTNSMMRVILMVGISYSDDPDDAIRIIVDVLDNQPGVLKSPAPMVTTEEFADSSINLRLCYYIDLRGTMSGFTIKSEMLTQIWRRFNEAGITIPFPQRDVHMFRAPQRTLTTADSIAAATVEEKPVARRDDGDWVGDAVEMAQKTDDDEAF
ncbi:mechanosensitive ion channel [Acuticoccus sp. M5D2P5]|uniref:mechanosensitive ion channel domain-containing protein n=1 Tax=Acuticoccus kalidii TaxID=2910977 RepID=UPI001F1F5F59|nr:mechanosensitive ion channel domain-containing protein [Acuticoccus kalidii]MCF3932713.1 mechanosensitive ion channel [Acuticoccus kalidii]